MPATPDNEENYDTLDLAQYRRRPIPPTFGVTYGLIRYQPHRDNRVIMLLIGIGAVVFIAAYNLKRTGRLQIFV